MKNNIRLCILGLVLLLALPAPLLLADELTEAIEDAERIQQQQQQMEGQLQGLTVKADEMEKTITELSSQITQAERDLNVKEVAYTKALKDVDDVTLAVAQKQQAVEARQQTLRNRSRSSYESGTVTYLEVFFQASSISDFLTRLEYINRVIENDRDILNGVRTEKAELERQKQLLIEKAAEAERLKQEAEAARRYLATSRQAQQTALNENQRDQDELMEEIEQLEKDSKELEAKIRDLQRSNLNGVVGSITTWPTPGCTYITSPFSMRVHPLTGVYKQHTGTDIGAANKSKIVAAGTGTVILASWYGAYGNAVIIDHGNGLSTLYGHMSSFAVQEGNTVVAGQVIGYVGSTGYSTGPHLHFEVRVDGTPQDPMNYYR
jgi:murein DD-endopeptidase MepM/ murein hydrolase activator NlpD